jgi:hypothetical protein
MGTFDYGGARSDIWKGAYGSGQTGPSTPFDWVSAYFTGVGNSFSQPLWGWVYHYQSQTLCNTYSGTTGDIIT